MAETEMSGVKACDCSQMIKDDETSKAFLARLNPCAVIVKAHRVRLPEDEVDESELKDLLPKLVKPPPRGIHPIIERVLFEEVRITDMIDILKGYLEDGKTRSQEVVEGDMQQPKVQDEKELVASMEPTKDSIEEAGDSAVVKAKADELKEAKDEESSGREKQ